jgi:hypothetical protein
MKKLHIILFFFFLTTLAWAQKPMRLNWQVVDEHLEPVQGITIVPKHVYFFLHQDYFDSGTDGDENGRFTLDVMPGKDTIILRRLGMKTVEIPITQETPSQRIVIMKPKPLELEEVVVKAYRLDLYTSRRCCGCTIRLLDSFKYDTINHKEVNKKTKIYPNPTSDFIFLQDQTSLGIVDVYALSGQQLERFNFTNQLNAQIDLSLWPAGTYVLRSSAGWTELAVLQKR